MKKWIPKILAYLLMIPIIMVGIFVGVMWNAALMMDYIFRDIKRGYKKELKTIHRNDENRIKEKK